MVRNERGRRRKDAGAKKVREGRDREGFRGIIFCLPDPLLVVDEFLDSTVSSGAKYVGFKRPGNDATSAFSFAVTYFSLARAEIF